MTAVLFDMDGVLVDVSRSYREAARRTAERYLGIPIDPDIIQGYKDRGGFNNDWDLVDRLLRDRGKVVGRERLVGVFQDLYLGHDGDGLMRFETWLPDPGLLDTLRESRRIGIVTGRPRHDAELALARFAAADLFDAIVTMDDLPAGKQKPHPAGIWKAMRRLGEHEAVYLGDGVDDMAAAARAGVRAVGVLPPGLDPKRGRRLLREAGAEMVLDSVNDVKEALT